MFTGIIILFCVSPTFVRGHCYGIGANPGFSNGPHVTQLTPFTVRVSWEKVVTRRDCSDHFIVRYWKTETYRNILQVPKDISYSEQLGQQANHVDLEVIPEVEFSFQVNAREVKKTLGITWDTDDNHSGITKFSTSYEPG